MTHEAPLQRPDRSTELRAYAAVVESAPDTVYARLVERLTPAGEYEVSFLADPVARVVVLQGQWWYRGEYRVLADGAGSRVEHEIVNVAPTLHWAGPITGRSVLAAAPGAFRDLLEGL